MLLTLSEAAARLGVAASTLRHQVGAGRLRAPLIGKTYVITEGELDCYRAESLGRPGRRHQEDASRAAGRPAKASQRATATST